MAFLGRPRIHGSWYKKFIGFIMAKQYSAINICGKGGLASLQQGWHRTQLDSIRGIGGEERMLVNVKIEGVPRTMEDLKSPAQKEQVLLFHMQDCVPTGTRTWLFHLSYLPTVGKKYQAR